jgi:hypothetical protein
MYLWRLNEGQKFMKTTDENAETFSKKKNPSDFWSKIAICEVQEVEISSYRLKFRFCFE